MEWEEQKLESPYRQWYLENLVWTRVSESNFKLVCSQSDFYFASPDKRER